MTTNPRVKMAQYGTKHGHAASVLHVMRQNPEVDFAGVYEPDAERRAAIAGTEPWSQVRWYDDKSEMLGDPDIVCIASEGLNAESLDQSEEIIDAGKNLWYDKPAGDDYRQFERVIAKAREKGLLVQMGYMFRENWAFAQVADWARSGLLGDIFSIRAHMSTNITEAQQAVIAHHAGGIFYDLGGHVLDQIVWILGRPDRITSFMRRDASGVDNFADNTVAILEYEKALAIVDIAAMEPKPMARRFEVYGTKGSAILGPFDPPEYLRLCLNEPAGGYEAGVTDFPAQPYRRHVESLERLIKTLRGEQEPDRSLDHELLVQETLLRAVGVHDVGDEHTQANFEL
ncbi:MAG: Gfo/Idh/MocA family oxidoreductase [Chloroflexi bacterium]|nr:Gfo/Idh/MocA family oxidoreductase [Chloroflexota bacterium]